MILTIRVLLPFSLGYFVSYLYRVVNAVVGPELQAELSLTNADIGLLTSVYFLTFAAAQLPLGVLLDRYGPRKTEAVLMLFAVAGGIVFASAHDLPTLIIGRALIGLGVAACLMAAFKAYGDRFPPHQVPLFNGIHLAAGGLGAIVAGAPFETLSGIYGWRSLFWVVSIVTIIIVFAIYFVVPKHDERRVDQTFGQLTRGFLTIMRAPAFMRIAPVCVASQAVGLAISTLWAGPWFQKVALMTSAEASVALSIMALCLTVGFLGLGAFTTYVARYGISTLMIAIATMALILVCQSVIIFSSSEVGIYAWWTMAFFASAGLLCYPVLVREFPSELSGRVNTGLNFLAFFTAFFIQWGIGIAVDQITGAGFNITQAFQITLGSLVILQIISFLWLFVSYRTSLSLLKPNS